MVLVFVNKVQDFVPMSPVWARRVAGNQVTSGSDTDIDKIFGIQTNMSLCSLPTNCDGSVFPSVLHITVNLSFSPAVI